MVPPLHGCDHGDGDGDGDIGEGDDEALGGGGVWDADKDLLNV